MESTQVALHGRIIAIRQSCFINNSAVIVTHQDVIKGGEYSLHILTCINNTLVARFVKPKRNSIPKVAALRTVPERLLQLDLPPLHCAI